MDVNQDDFQVLYVFHFIFSEGSDTLIALSYQNKSSMLLDTTFRGGYSASFFEYDKYGRLLSSVNPTGSKMVIRSVSSPQVLTLQIKVDGALQEPIAGIENMESYGATILISPGYIYDEITVRKGKSCVFPLAIFCNMLCST